MNCVSARSSLAAAPHRIVNRDFAIFAARSKSRSPSASPSSSWDFGVNPNARGVPRRRTSTFWSSVVPAGRFLRGTIVAGLQLFGVVDQAAALGVAGEDILHELGAAPVGKPARDRLGILTDQPEVQHGRYCASTGAELSASTRATEPTWSSGSSSMMRTPQVLRPCEETSAAWKRIILPLVVTTRM